MKEKKIAGMILLLALVFAMVIECFSHRQKLDAQGGITAFNTGWQWIDGGEEKAEVTLPANLEISPGDVLVLKNYVPEDFLLNSGIVFRSRQQSVEVYVSGKLIYAYPEEKLEGGVLPSNWNFVKLPAKCQGEELVIKLFSPFRGFSGGMEEVYYGNYNELLLFIMRRQLPIFLLSIFIGITGMAVVLLAVIFRKYHLYRYQDMQGIVMILASLWLCGESRMPVFFLGIETKYYITVAALVLMPVFLYAYLCARWRNLYIKFTRKLFYISIFLGSLILGLAAAGVKNFIEMLVPIHILVAAALVYTIWMYIRAFQLNKGNILRSEMFCIILIAVGGVAEIIIFYIMRGILVGTYVRTAILIYALNLLRVSLLISYRGLRERMELKEQLQKSRIDLMSSQIKPHFVYNTLNSIRTLIRIDPEAAYKTVYDFSTYLRGNLNSMEGRETIPFSEELKHVEAYVNIEKIRFGDRVQVEFQIEAKSFQVPSLSVQPLVENAIKHGVCKKIEGGTVWVKSYETSEHYVIQVDDDGVGFDMEAMEKQETGQDKEHTSLGLKNIRFRIWALLRGTMEICSFPGEGTRVTIRIPKSTKEEQP